MKILRIVYAFFLLSLASKIFSNTSLPSHSHGSVHLDIGVEGKQFLVMLKSPAESFLGFEYSPKSEKEKQALQELKMSWNKNLLLLIEAIDFNDCKISNSKIEQDVESEGHSDISAEAIIICEKDVSGRSLSVELKKSYKRINTIFVQLIRADGTALNQKFDQSSFTLKL